MLSDQQKIGLMLIKQWLSTSDPIFNLNGFAGTGKTTLAKSLKEITNRPVRFAAYTGKATVRLRQKGCEANTLHSLIYVPAGDSEQMVELTKRYRNAKDAYEKKRIRDQIEALKARGGGAKFILKQDSPFEPDAILVIDEASMISYAMLEDIQQHVKKIILLGDPAQLPPVMGRSILDNIPHDYLLTEVHRQAADNPIIRAATMARNGERLPTGVWWENETGEFRCLDAKAVAWEDYAAADQMLVATNRARRGFNRRYRERLGRSTPVPEPGERVIILRNMYDVEPPLYNGTVLVVSQVNAFEDEWYIDGVDEVTGEVRQGIPVWDGAFLGLEATGCPRDFVPADYAYAMTVHKAQGSEWNNVLVYQEGGSSSDRQWIYTAITRAAKNCLIVRP